MYSIVLILAIQQLPRAYENQQLNWAKACRMQHLNLRSIWRFLNSIVLRGVLSKLLEFIIINSINSLVQLMSVYIYFSRT